MRPPSLITNYSLDRERPLLCSTTITTRSLNALTYQVLNMRRAVLRARPAARCLRQPPLLTEHASLSSPFHRQLSSTRQLREEPRPSFKGQLYESTQQRLKRERAEQERFSQYQTQSPGSRYAALMFGMYPCS